MFEVVNHTEIPVSPDQLWSILNDLPQYAIWHPSLWFTGAASHNAVIEYGFQGLVGGLQNPTAPARIVVFEPPTAIGWRLGIPALMWADEWYRITRAGAATCVEHGVRCSGPLSWFMRRLVTRKVQPLLDAADAALVAYTQGLPKVCPRCGGVHRPIKPKPHRRRRSIR